MKSNKISNFSILSLLLSAAAMVIVLFVPLWRIDLDAPQYPEGLRLLIYPHKLAGNVDIINGLNHYIGMKTLHTEDFIEFTLLPYIISFFALLFVIAAFMRRVKMLYIAFLLFVAFGIIAMVDFWRWEYDYGHSLAKDAAIIVPGMSYQPPLIGFKQLLNFGAYSIPDTGGWLFIGAGVLLLLALLVEWRRKKAALSIKKTGLLVPTLLLMYSCNTRPTPIIVGRDTCDYCKMIISDARFGAEIVTGKGRVYKFDDTHCLLSFLAAQKKEAAPQQQIYFTDFGKPHTLVAATVVLLLKSEHIRSPMGSNIAAFGNRDTLKSIQEVYKGNTIQWNELYTP
jgi:copper chaperone NosL